jgi:hypothetical protein
MDTEAMRLRLAVLEAEKAISDAGANPTPALLALVREEATAHPELSGAEIVTFLKSENPDSFKPREDPVVRTKPAERTLREMSEPEKQAFVAKHGLDKFKQLVVEQAERDRAEMRRKFQGF